MDTRDLDVAIAKIVRMKKFMASICIFTYQFKLLKGQIMEEPMQASVGGSSAPSSFSGQKYNPSQNTTTHYKAGNNGSKKKKRKDEKSATPKKNVEKQLDGAAVVKADKNKYSNGKQPDYMQASVFKKK